MATCPNRRKGKRWRRGRDGSLDIFPIVACAPWFTHGRSEGVTEFHSKGSSKCNERRGEKLGFTRLGSCRSALMVVTEEVTG